MSAHALQLQPTQDQDEIVAWAAEYDFNLSQVDCLITIMLKILDGKCKMDQQIQLNVWLVYQQAHQGRSRVFDPAIHGLIADMYQQPDPLSRKHIHELRCFAETEIPKTTMKGFKQWLWAVMP